MGVKEFLKPTRGKLIITILFLLALILGIFAVFPFGSITREGDLVVQKFSPFLIIKPLLAFISFILITLGIKGIYNDISGILILIGTSVIYYHLISCVLIYIYNKITGVNRVASLINKTQDLTICKFLKEFLRPTVGKVVLTILFIISVFLSFFGIPPFSFPEMVGSTIIPEQTILVKFHFSPLMFLLDKIIKFNFKDGPRFFLFFIGILYYYIFSCLMLYLYSKIRGIKRKKQNEKRKKEVEKKTSKLAIASIVLSILGFTLMFLMIIIALLKINFVGYGAELEFMPLLIFYVLSPLLAVSAILLGIIGIIRIFIKPNFCKGKALCLIGILIGIITLIVIFPIYPPRGGGPL